MCFRHAAEQTRIENEMESLKELLHTYEQSIERKDQVISNLTRAMQQQKDRFDMLKTFCEWKIRHNDVKREVQPPWNEAIFLLFLEISFLFTSYVYVQRRYYSVSSVIWCNRWNKTCLYTELQINYVGSYWGRGSQQFDVVDIRGKGVPAIWCVVIGGGGGGGPGNLMG